MFLYMYMYIYSWETTQQQRTDGGHRTRASELCEQHHVCKQTTALQVQKPQVPLGCQEADPAQPDAEPGWSDAAGFCKVSAAHVHVF